MRNLNLIWLIFHYTRRCATCQTIEEAFCCTVEEVYADAVIFPDTISMSRRANKKRKS